MRRLCLVVAGLAFTTAVSAQDQARDSSWVVLYDHANTQDTTLFLVVMHPGWHVTTGPAITMYKPKNTAEGHYLLKSTIFVFNDDANPYGVVVAGKDMDGPDPSYITFVLRNDGQFGIFHRAGHDSHTVMPWSPHNAIHRQTADADGPAKNVLIVDVGHMSVDFYINGERVHSQDRSGIDLDGIYGLRVNDETNLHVSELTVAQM